MFQRISLLAFLAGLFVSLTARAQFSVQESDSNNRLKVFGKEWNTNFFSLASVETDKYRDQGGRLSTYNYFTFSTREGDYRYALRLPFQYNTAGTDRFNGDKVNEQEILLQDLILGVQNYELAYLPWDIGLYWEGRVYLPTSKFSRKSQMIGRYRNTFIFSRVFSRYFETEYDNKVSYYVQSRSTYANSFENDEGYTVNTVSQTKQWELEHRLSLWGKVTPKFGFGWQFGAEDTYWNKSKSENKSKPGERMVSTGPAVRFPLNDNINFILNYTDKTTRQKSGSELGRFYSTNTEMTLLSFVRF